MGGLVTQATGIGGVVSYGGGGTDMSMSSGMGGGMGMGRGLGGVGVGGEPDGMGDAGSGYGGYGGYVGAGGGGGGALGMGPTNGSMMGLGDRLAHLHGTPTNRTRGDLARP